MNKQRDSKERIAFPIQLFGEGSKFAEIPDEIHVVPTGKWNHPAYGEMEINSADIAEFVKNFKANVRNDLPITQGHDNGMSGGELPASRSGLSGIAPHCVPLTPSAGTFMFMICIMRRLAEEGA